MLTRTCQCTKTYCKCRPCTNDFTQEDFLCDPCRAIKKSKGRCCHKESELPKILQKVHETAKRLRSLDNGA